MARVACLSDRRVCHAELTPEGRVVICEILPEHARRLRQITDGLSLNEKRGAIALLERLLANDARKPR